MNGLYHICIKRPLVNIHLRIIATAHSDIGVIWILKVSKLKAAVFLYGVL